MAGVTPMEIFGAAGAIANRLASDPSAQERLAKCSGQARDHLLIAMALTEFLQALTDDGADAAPSGRAN